MPKRGGRFTPPKSNAELLTKAVKDISVADETPEESDIQPGEQEFETRIPRERNPILDQITKVNIGEMPSFERQTPQEKPTPPPAPPKGRGTVVSGTKNTVVKERTNQWKNWIYEDFNPLLVKYTSQFVGIPDNPPELAAQQVPNQFLHGVVLAAIHPQTNKPITFWDPPLYDRLSLDEKQAKKLAAAAAEFSVSPMGVAVVTWIETHQFMITMGAALIVAAQYGWTLMQTKAEVGQVKQIIEEQTKVMRQQQEMLARNGQHPAGANVGSPQPEPRLPGFNESVTSYDFNPEQNS
jgi:hypothetical protein